MASLAQEQVIAFLELNTQWLESQAPTINQLRWLYSALVRLDDVIEADNVALLRTLAKSCIAMRDQIVCSYANVIRAEANARLECRR